MVTIGKSIMVSLALKCAIERQSFVFLCKDGYFDCVKETKPKVFDSVETSEVKE